MNPKPNILVLVTALALLLTAKIQGQTTSPPYLSQFPSPEMIKADVKGVDAMETAAKQAGIFWQLRQLIYDLALSQRRTDRQFSPDEQRLEVEFRNAHYKAIEPFEGKVTGADKPKWFELRGKYEMDLWLRDEVFKKYFTPDLRRAVYVALKGQLPTENAPEASRLTPSAASLTAARSNSSTSSSTARPSTQPGTYASKTFAEYVAEGKRYREAKDWAKAVEVYKKAVALNPERADAQFFLGASYFPLRQFQSALPAMKEAVRLKPEEYTHHFMLGLILFELKQYDKALPAFQQSMKLKPDYPDNHYWIGRVYSDGYKQYDKAISELQEALRLEPNFAAYRDLGAIYYILGKYPEALELSQRAVSLAPNNALAQLNLGRTLLKLRRKDEAVQVYYTLAVLDQEQAQKLYADINAEPTGTAQSVKTPGGNSPKSNQSQSSSSQGAGPAIQTKALPSTADAATQKIWVRAQAGDASSQNSLGRIYQNGRKGLPADKAEARKWYRLAAEQGNASGKVHLCESYADELHISDDSDDKPGAPIRALTGLKAVMGEAMKWCGAAANIGYTGGSKYYLGVLYAKGGPGVKPNYEEAYFWLSMSKGVFRDKVGKKLTREKRTEIEQRADAWKPPGQ